MRRQESFGRTNSAPSCCSGGSEPVDLLLLFVKVQDGTGVVPFRDLAHVELAGVFLVGEFLHHQFPVRGTPQRKQENKIATSPTRFVEIAVRHRKHRHGNVKVPASNAKVRQLLPVVVFQGDVVYQYKDVPDSALAHKVLLLLFQSGYEFAVPLVKLEIVKPYGFEKVVKFRVTVLAAHKRNDQVKVPAQLLAQVVVKIRFALPAVPYH